MRARSRLIAEKCIFKDVVATPSKKILNQKKSEVVELFFEINKKPDAQHTKAYVSNRAIEVQLKKSQPE